MIWPYTHLLMLMPREQSLETISLCPVFFTIGNIYYTHTHTHTLCVSKVPGDILFYANFPFVNHILFVCKNCFFIHCIFSIMVTCHNLQVLYFSHIYGRKSRWHFILSLVIHGCIVCVDPIHNCLKKTRILRLEYALEYSEVSCTYFTF